MVTLEEQDRSLWDRAEISEGLALVEKALRRGPLGPYQLQAAIGALHAEPATPQETDWPQIATLYARLLEFNDSPVIALNHAVEVAMSAADILRRMGRLGEAKEAYRRALDLATNRVEQEFLQRRIVMIESDHK